MAKNNGSKEVVKVEGLKPPAVMIAEAVKNGGDLEKLQGLLDLQMKWEQNEAKKAYNADMVLVQQDIPLVVKNLKNEQTRSKYAGLDDIISKTKVIYTHNGFSISFYEGETARPDYIRICADVVHRLGHKETYHYDVPLDGRGIKGNPNMTAIHAKASSTAYGRRYLMCMIWNIPTGDDNDGVTMDIPVYIDDQQQMTICDIVDNLKNAETRKANFLRYMGVESVDQILAKDYKKALNVLAIAQKKESQKKESVK